MDLAHVPDHRAGGCAHLQVTSIAPRTGASGSQVTISRTGFSSDQKVCFGSAASPDYRVNDSGTRITAVVPSGSGTVQVVVVTNVGASPRLLADA